MPKIALSQIFVDCITHELIQDPVFTADGHTYERSSITEWLKNHDTSPATGLKLAHKNLTPNIFFKKSLDEFKQENNICAEEELFKAVESGDTKQVKKLNFLKQHLKVKDKSGQTVLHCAVNGGNLKMVRILLSNGASANTPDEVGNTPLHNAALKNNFKVIQLLLAFGAKPNTKNRHTFTPLHLAALNCSVEAMDQLLANNEAALEIKEHLGWTALHCAAAGGSKEAVVLLLKRGANPGAKNDKGLTPSAVAREERNFAIANFIGNCQSHLEVDKKIIELRKGISNQQEKIEIYAAERDRDAAKIKQLEEENRKLKEQSRTNYSGNHYMKKTYADFSQSYSSSLPQDYQASGFPAFKANK